MFYWVFSAEKQSIPPNLLILKKRVFFYFSYAFNTKILLCVIFSKKKFQHHVIHEEISIKITISLFSLGNIRNVHLNFYFIPILQLKRTSLPNVLQKELVPSQVFQTFRRLRVTEFKNRFSAYVKIEPNVF